VRVRVSVGVGVGGQRGWRWGEAMGEAACSVSVFCVASCSGEAMTRGGTPPAPPAYIGRESGVASRGGSKVGRGGAGMSRGGPASHSSVALGASSDLAVGVLHHGRYAKGQNFSVMRHAHQMHMV